MSKTVSELQKVLGQVAKDEPGRRLHSLYDKVCRRDVLWVGWLQVQQNGGSGGVDGKELSDYSELAAQQALIEEIHDELLSCSYRPQPVRRTYISKPDGGERPLGIPTIKDRVVQTAVKLILEPIYEADFHEFSYGFRSKKSCHQACQAVWKWMNFGYTTVIDADIHKYFESIPHEKLLRSVARRVGDGKVLWLLQQWLKTPISADGRLIRSLMGTPQGGVISPLLANIYLHHLDNFWVSKGYARNAKLVRYADDFVIMCNGRTDFYLSELHRLLNNLELELSDKKTKVVQSTQQGFDFLGFQFRRVWAYRPQRHSFGWVTGVRLSRNVVRKARQHMNELVGKGGRKSPVPMLELVKRVNSWLKHWLPYYSYANDRRDFRHVHTKVVLERLVRAEVARKNGTKRRCGKWKSMNPQLWEMKYGLLDVVEVYYRKRKQLYASLFEHPINV